MKWPLKSTSSLHNRIYWTPSLPGIFALLLMRRGLWRPRSSLKIPAGRGSVDRSPGPVVSSCIVKCRGALGSGSPSGRLREWRREEGKEAGREEKEMGWLAARNFQGALVHDRSHSCLSGGPSAAQEHVGLERRDLQCPPLSFCSAPLRGSEVE